MMSSSITRRQTLGGAASVLGGLVLPVKARAATKMRYVTPFNFSLSYSAVFYARTGGFFDREGLDVEVINGKGAATAAQLVIAAQAEVARTGGANYIVSRVDSGAPLISIGTIAQISPFFMVSPPGAAIRQPSDLKGKTIGIKLRYDDFRTVTRDQTLALAVDQPAALLGANEVEPDEEYLVVQASDGTVREVVRALVAAEIGVDAVIPAREQGLEDYFLGLTQSSDVDTQKGGAQ